ncbi:hypothetical protein LR48_Vigan04g040200 [Vigna angularis]|uniref:Transposase (putative) gypsy type domain-containing protein n=1 Tax=Phaseolus angularis TaxID=3914 RepID=A0A0L9UCF3_PHAAN|nr:hypothetical protein LR48_Vigan04g040200 [Vigna angularis]
MEPCIVLDCTPESGEEMGQSSNAEGPGASSVVSYREITTILSGESAFLYGNVVIENPKNPSSLSPSVSGYDWASRDMDVLKILNVVPTHLHPNSWGYIQAFAVMCQALAIRPTLALFLHFFRARPVAKRGWVSLIFEPGNAILELYSQSFRGFKDKFFRVTIAELGRPFFFNEDNNPRFPLYWTQDPLKFTSWSEDKMTIKELDALNVLTALSRSVSSRRIINCLEHDDAGSKVFDTMGRKGLVCDWFKAMSDPKPNNTRVAQTTVEGVARGRATNPPQRKGGQSVDKPTSSKKMKEVEESSDRSIPGGVWDLAFNLGHKIAFNLDESENKVVEKMTEQHMTDTALELMGRAAMATWHLAYASDMGVLRVELQKVQTQRKEAVDAHSQCEQKQKLSEQLLNEARARKEVSNQKSVITALRAERDTLLLNTAEDKELKEEMGEVIVLEHTRGFKKALRLASHLLNVSIEGVDFDPRKYVYEGRLVPLSKIPKGALLEFDAARAKEEVVTETTVAGEVKEEDPAVPSTNVDDVVHIQ